MHNSTAVKVLEIQTHMHTLQNKHVCIHVIITLHFKDLWNVDVFLQYRSIWAWQGVIPGFGHVAFWLSSCETGSMFFSSVSTYLAAREWNPEGYLGMFQKLIGSFCISFCGIGSFRSSRPNFELFLFSIIWATIQIATRKLKWLFGLHRGCWVYIRDVSA